MDCKPTPSFFVTFASPRSGVAQESVPPRFLLFIRFVSDVSPAPSDAFLGSSRSAEVIEYLIIKNGVLELDQYSEAISSVKEDENPKMLYVIKDRVLELKKWCCDVDILNPESSETNKMLYVIKYRVRELNQWCNKLLKYSEAVSSLKQDDRAKAEDGLVQEEQQKECKEGVKVDRVGEAFVVEINCPCGRNYRTLFSGRDCYCKLHK